jgi:hypothetical protein
MPLAGGSLDPRDIVGRDVAVREMQALVARGADIVINDPRRMGKTCLLDRFAYLTRPPWAAIKIDYEGVLTADQFLNRTIIGLRGHEPLRARVIKSVRSYMDNVEVGAGPLKIAAAFQGRSPSELLDTTIQRVDELLTGDERLVLALDEVPLAIENIAKNEKPLIADALLQTLRRLRQSTNGIRWIVTGSVGFHHVLRLAGSTEGAINDLVNVSCGPLDQLWAQELASMLLRGIEADFDEQTVMALVELSGGIPFLLHHLANVLRGLAGPCTAVSVTEAWDTFVNDRDLSKAATHLLTRIGDYYGEHGPVAFEILDAVAMAPTPISASSISARFESGGQILDYLVDDHYLTDTPLGLAWRYPVLRRIWVTRRRLV